MAKQFCGITRIGTKEIRKCNLPYITLTPKADEAFIEIWDRTWSNPHHHSQTVCVVWEASTLSKLPAGFSHRFSEHTQSIPAGITWKYRIWLSLMRAAQWTFPLHLSIFHSDRYSNAEFPPPLQYNHQLRHSDSSRRKLAENRLETFNFVQQCSTV